jgi:uncharacterized membrane protein
MNGDGLDDAAGRRKDRFRDVVTGVFGLVLALSAFSVTTADYASTDEVWQALGLFAPAFFFVLLIWQTTADLFDRYPAGDGPFYALVTLVLFLTTLAPAFLNLLLDEQPSVQRLSGTLFPVAMAAIFALLMALWLRLRALAARQGGPPDADLAENALVAGALAALFLASLLAPFEPAGHSPRTIAWFAAFILPGALLWLGHRAGRRRPPPGGEPPTDRGP